MTRALVFGASGAIGRFLLPRLAALGCEVFAVSRDAHASSDANLHWLRGGLADNVPPLPPVDAIFSLGPLDVFARWYARAGDANARVIALGSMSAASKRESSDADERELARRLLAAEQELGTAAAARGGAWTVLRATLIYGAGIDRSLSPIARFARRTRVFPLLPGAHGLRQPVHADDLAAACIAVWPCAVAQARIYALGGGERLTFAEMLRRVRASLPAATLPLPIPLPLLRLLARSGRLPGFAQGSAALARLGGDLVAEHAPAVADFGWSPRAFRPLASDWDALP